VPPSQKKAVSLSYVERLEKRSPTSRTCRQQGGIGRGWEEGEGEGAGGEGGGTDQVPPPPPAPPELFQGPQGSTVQQRGGAGASEQAPPSSSSSSSTSTSIDIHIPVLTGLSLRPSLHQSPLSLRRTPPSPWVIL
jgi:hypothetical protein